MLSLILERVGLGAVIFYLNTYHFYFFNKKIKWIQGRESWVFITIEEIFSYYFHKRLMFVNKSRLNEIYRKINFCEYKK